MLADLLYIISILILGIVFIVVVAYILQRKFEKRLLSVSATKTVYPRYPKPSDDLLHQIKSIQPSGSYGIEYRPSMVTLVDGRIIDCVYFVQEQQYNKHWGIWPEDDKGKLYLHIQEITKVEESPTRLPSKIANELYRVGETGMGYFCFTIIFSDRSKQVYMTGNAVDFVPLPEGKTLTDIVEVLPGVGSGNNYLQGLNYYWCLYS